MTSTLPPQPTLKDLQQYIYKLEEQKGWLDHGLVMNCFFLGEEMGELFRAVRKAEKMGFDVSKNYDNENVAEELVDCFNYLLAIANRLDIDLEEAFRAKNAKNEQRVWA